MPKSIGLKSIGLSLLAIALFTLSGCSVGSDANFYVNSAHSGVRDSALIPQGSGWPSNSRIEISLWNEPQIDSVDNKVVTGEPRSLAFVNADSLGMFGFNSGAYALIVQRKIPGAPPAGLPKPVFVARDTGSGLVRFHESLNDVWFTFKQ